MLELLETLLVTAASALKPRCDLALENLALRQQLAVFTSKKKRPRLTKSDRLFWVALRRVWSGWADALVIVKPETVVRGTSRIHSKVGEDRIRRRFPTVSAADEVLTKDNYS